MNPYTITPPVHPCLECGVVDCICPDDLAPLGDRHIGELRDVPQEPYRLANGETNHNQIAIDAFRASTPADFDDRPRLHIEGGPAAAFVLTEARLMAGIEAYQRHRHEGPAAIVTAVHEAMVRA